MGLADTFVDPMGPCLSPNWTFPSISDPGMPNFVLGCFLANFAGINFVLQFIPPTPDILPSIAPPSIGLFLDAFLSGVNLPSSYPSISFGPLTIPGKGVAPYPFDVSGLMKLMVVCILLPFTLITNMVTGLLNLEVKIPTLDGIEAIFLSIAADVGLNTPSVAAFAHCLAESIAALFSSLI